MAPAGLYGALSTEGLAVPGASPVNSEFQSSCLAPQSHLPRVQGGFFPAEWTCSSLPHPPPLSPPKQLRAPIPGPLQPQPWSPAHLTLAAAHFSSATFTLEGSHRPHCQSHAPGSFIDSWNCEAAKTLKDCVQTPPLTDHSYLGPKSHMACPRPLSQLAADLGPEPKALNDP